MVYRKVLALTAALLLTAGLAQAAERYMIDPGHSHVAFSVRHFGVSNVRGEFKKYDGHITVDEEDAAQSSIEIRIETASIFTDHEQRDGHLRSGDFLDAENHPEIVFKSKTIEKTGADQYVATGDLTIRGVTKQVELAFNLSGPIKDPLGMMRLGAEGGVTINRHDYGVTWNRVMDAGGLFVGNDVRISFSIEATRPLEEASGSGS